MRPEVIAHVTDAVGYANANTAAKPFLSASIVADPMVYPSAEEQQRLFIDAENSPELIRTTTRLWQKFKTGQ